MLQLADVFGCLMMNYECNSKYPDGPVHVPVQLFLEILSQHAGGTVPQLSPIFLVINNLGK